jgi:carbonic anhydrase
MTSPNLVPIPGGRALFELQSQARRAESGTPGLLVLTCAEPDPCGPPRWQRALGPALQLRSPGASLERADIREALHYAVEELGVKELLVALHSRCAHLDSPPSPTELHEERGLPFMERVARRRSRAEGQLEAARERVRASLLALGSDPVLQPVARVGLVHVVESGLLLAYDPSRDDFEALI